MRYGPNDFPPIPAGTISKGCGSPFALIKRGGGRPGMRPFTRLAFITDIRSDDGGRTLKIRGLIKVENGWTKHCAREIAEGDVVAQWRSVPARTVIVARRRALPPA